MNSDKSGNLAKNFTGVRFVRNGRMLDQREPEAKIRYRYIPNINLFSKLYQPWGSEGWVDLWVSEECMQDCSNTVIIVSINRSKWSCHTEQIRLNALTTQGCYMTVTVYIHHSHINGGGMVDIPEMPDPGVRQITARQLLVETSIISAPENTQVRYDFSDHVMTCTWWYRKQDF